MIELKWSLTKDYILLLTLHMLFIVTLRYTLSAKIEDKFIKQRLQPYWYKLQHDSKSTKNLKTVFQQIQPQWKTRTEMYEWWMFEIFWVNSYCIKQNSYFSAKITIA